ncbi:MAG: AsmA family protein, partial [Gammaproteobacteria bacterium]
AAPRGLEFGAEWSALRFDPTGGELAIDDLVTRVAGVAASWQLEARNVIDAPSVAGRVAIAHAPIGEALASFGVALPQNLDPRSLGTLDASAQFRIGLAVDGTPGAEGPAIGPYRLEALGVDGLELAALGLRASGRAELADDGHVRADLTVPAFTPSDALLALVRGYVPDGVDLSAIDRLAISGRADVDVESGRTSLHEARVAALGAEIVTSLELVSNENGPRIGGTLRVSNLESARVAQLLGSLWPADLDPALTGTLAANTRFDYDGAAERLALEDLTLGALGLSASGRVTIASLGGDAPTAAGELRIAAFSPRDVLRRLNQPVPETSDEKALARASLAARFDASAKAMRFTNVDLALDDSRITGEFGIDQLDAATPTYRFAIAIDRVNVDRYLPPPASAVPENAAPDTPTAGDIELPKDALANLAIEGRVTVGELRLAGLNFAQVSTALSVGNGRASIGPAKARLYGGEFDGTLHVDTTSEPGLRLTGRATSLDLEPLITALTGDANFSGTGDFDLDLSGRGETVIKNVETANGQVRFEMRNGAIDGFNLGRGLCVVYNATQRLPAPAEQPDKTEYLLIRGTASVKDGVASSNDLLARASFMDLTGRGTLVLAAQRLDYSLEAKLTGSTGIRGCEAMDGLVGESLPLVLRGTVTDPEIRPDFSEIIERRLRNEVRDRVRDAILDRLLR